MNRLFAALRFLTILPLPGTRGTASDDLARSVPMFPLVGLLLGLLAGAVAWGLSMIAPPLLAAAGVVAAMLAFSGGLHMDGLSDTADGFLSSRPRERIVEIMKDSHVGAMGVIVIVCTLLIKFAALASLPGQFLWAAAFLAPLCGRCVMVLQMAMLPYIRPNGLGSVFNRRSLNLAAVGAVILLTAASCSIFACSSLHDANVKNMLLAGVGGLAVVTAAVVSALAFSFYCYRKIGGATGDTYGAACELGELVTVVALAIWTFSVR